MSDVSLALMAAQALRKEANKWALLRSQQLNIANQVGTNTNTDTDIQPQTSNDPQMTAVDGLHNLLLVVDVECAYGSTIYSRHTKSRPQPPRSHTPKISTMKLANGAPR